jgi:hypothetical protein
MVIKQEHNVTQLTLEDGINAVLNFMMDELKAYNTLIEHHDYFDGEFIPELNQISSKDYDKIEKYSTSTWETKFKKHFGFTDMQFNEQQQRIFRASLTERERALIKQIEEVCIVELWFKNESGKVGGTFYYKSPGKLAYFPTNYDGGIAFKDSWLEQMGWKLAEVEAFLLKIGATKGKRPKNPRPIPSLYD